MTAARLGIVGIDMTILNARIGGFIVIRDVAPRCWLPGEDTARAYAAKANPKERPTAQRIKLVALCVEGIHAGKYCVLDTAWAGRPVFDSLKGARDHASAKSAGLCSIVRIIVEYIIKCDPSEARQVGKLEAKVRRTLTVDDIKFLDRVSWEVLRKYPPVQRDARSNLMRLGEPTVCRCGAQGPHLQAAHKIPFMIGVLNYGVDPDWLNGAYNLEWACRERCNKAVEFSTEEIEALLHSHREKMVA